MRMNTYMSLSHLKKGDRENLDARCFADTKTKARHILARRYGVPFHSQPPYSPNVVLWHEGNEPTHHKQVQYGKQS